MVSRSIPKVVFQAHELTLRAWAFDQRGEYSHARNYYVQATRLFTSIFMKFPHTIYLPIWKNEAQLCLSRIIQIRLLRKKEKLPLPTRSSPEFPHHQQQHELEESMHRCQLTPNPNLNWSHVFGLDQVVQEIKKVVFPPLRHPELLQGNIKCPRSVLLFGPPGCGKTLILFVLAAEAGIPVFSVSAANLLSMWQGESQKKIRALFEAAWAKAPSIIFIDEFDGMFSSPSQKSGLFRRPQASTPSITAMQIQKELQQYMDGIKTPSINQTVTIAATNFPWHIQHSQLRRFDRILYVHPPTSQTIHRLLTHFLNGVDHTLTADDLYLLSLKLKGYTPDEIKKVCEEARLRMYDTNPPRVLKRTDIDECLTLVEPMLLQSKNEEGVGTRRFREWNVEFGRPHIKYPLEAWEKQDYTPKDDPTLNMLGIGTEMEYRRSLRNDDVLF